MNCLMHKRFSDVFSVDVFKMSIEQHDLTDKCISRGRLKDLLFSRPPPQNYRLDISFNKLCDLRHGEAYNFRG